MKNTNTELNIDKEETLIVFTKGDNLRVDVHGGISYTGDWKIIGGANKDIENIIVYHRTDNGNRVYTGKIINYDHKSKTNREAIKFKLKDTLMTNKNWPDFKKGGSAQHVALYSNETFDL